jgi:hypothetical protein
VRRDEINQGSNHSDDIQSMYPSPDMAYVFQTPALNVIFLFLGVEADTFLDRNVPAAGIIAPFDILVPTAS